MSQKPHVYAELLAKRMSEHDTRCILLNTGWTGGPHGVGQRMSLKHTRKLLDAALSGEFDGSELVSQPILNLRMPTTCEGVPDEILNPRGTWDNSSEYDKQATELREMFRRNYEEKGFADLGIAAAM
jgi:phosphoenolpyruvate carboxykinase (ATP)